MHTPIFMHIGMQTNKNMHRESERQIYTYTHAYAGACFRPRSAIARQSANTHKSHVTPVTVGVMAHCLHAPRCLMTSL